MRLFAGVMPALVLVINPILQYTVYEQLKNFVEKTRRITPRDSFYLGALGKLAATSITYPYITVKSRMHVAGKSGRTENTLSSLRRILREEGWSGLYGGKCSWYITAYGRSSSQNLGIGPKVTQSVITAAFLFAFKEALYDATVKFRQNVLAKRL